jgi:hypothetical protein
LGGNHRELAEGWLPYIECCLDQAPKRAALREEARRLAERALGVFETLGKDGEGKARATAEFLLARALDVDPRERARARALAQSAAARLTQGEGSERRAAEIRAWLAARARE